MTDIILSASAAYTPSDWYWLADDGRVFASARVTTVTASDEGFAAAKAAGRVTRWPVDAGGAQSSAALQAVLSPHGLFVDLVSYAASARYAKETAGITVGTATIATDRDSQGMITGMWAAAQINPQISVSFKSGSGFVSISAAQIARIASAVAAHVQACFTAEGQINSAITAGTLKTTAAVDTLLNSAYTAAFTATASTTSTTGNTSAASGATS